MKKADIDKIIHGTQIAALAMFGLAIYSPQTLTNIGGLDFTISQINAYTYGFWALMISLAYEHFMFK